MIPDDPAGAVARPRHSGRDTSAGPSGAPGCRPWHIYAALLAVTVLAGLATRLFRGTAAHEWAANAGDGLWAVAVYLVAGLLFRWAPPRALFWITVLTATGVELSQLYHAPWIDALRRTTPGGLLLGYGFSWTDLLCYWAAAAICLLVEHRFRYSGIQVFGCSGDGCTEGAPNT